MSYPPGVWINPPPPGTVDEHHIIRPLRDRILSSSHKRVFKESSSRRYTRSRSPAEYECRDSRSYSRSRSRSRDRYSRRSREHRYRRERRHRRSRSRSHGSHKHSSRKHKSSRHKYSRSRSRSRSKHRRSKSLSPQCRSRSRSFSSSSDSDANSYGQGAVKEVPKNQDYIRKVYSKRVEVPTQENTFKNDGSFLEMFKKMQEEKAAEEKPETTIQPVEEVKKPPAFGKRRGGRVLKTGLVAKPKNPDEVEEEPKDAWSVYMKEVKRYKEACCDDDSKTRPLVK